MYTYIDITFIAFLYEYGNRVAGTGCLATTCLYETS